jgi:hypothetical protein
MHLGEAAALPCTAAFMGGSGGAAYHLVIRSRINSVWKPFVAVLAAIEGYFLTFALWVMVMGLVAPKLTEGMPLREVRFLLLLQGYGLLLCLVAFGFVHSLRIAQVVVVVVGFLLVVLGGVMMVMFLGIGPECLDLWFAFLKTLLVAYQVLLTAFAVVSIVGWWRFVRRIREERKSHKE